MALTRPRAAQIYNLDYKQATRVVTVANITLSGGAPATVDGVSLSANNRILVTAQSTGSQNGIYLVSTVGSGSNGTWVRTNDANDTGEIEAGMIVMVTEGSVYADTQWKLITDDPITIGSTALTFTQNYSANSISGGTSNVTVYSNANVTISSAGTSNVLIVSSTGLVVAGTVSATGNITGSYFIGNGSQLTGVAAGSTYSNSNVTSLLAAFGSNTISTTGTITSASLVGGSITISGNNITGTGATLTIDPNGSGGNDGNVIIAGNLSVTGNITYIDSNVITTNEKSITLANNVNTGSAADGSGVDIGNNTLAYWRFNNATTSWQSNIGLTPAANGTLNLGGTSNYWATVYATGSSISGNVTGGNILTGGLISATGNITGGNITIPGSANISTFIGNVFFGSVPAQPTYYNIAPLNINNSLAAATKVQLNLINTGGGAGAGSGIDFYTYQISVAAANAEARIAGIDDGNYSAYLSLQTKTPGSTGTNTLVERVKIDSTGASVVANITGGNLLTGGLVSATGNITTANTLTATGTTATGVLAAVLGTANVALHAFAIVTAAGSANSSAQFAFQNNNTGSNASTDIALYNNNGTDTSYFVDMGIVSSTYNGTASGANLFSANDGYVYVAGNSITGPVGSGANIGNLILGATNGQVITWLGNTSTANIITRVSTTGLAVTGVVSATANVTGGNILTGGLVSATSTITGTSLLGAVVSVTGAITGASVVGGVMTGSSVSVTGNITGSFFNGNGSALTGVSALWPVTNTAGVNGPTTISIGQNANAGTNGVVIGYAAGQGGNAYTVAVGGGAGGTGQNTQAVAVGYGAGATSQGTYSVAIGTYAGYSSQAQSSIVLNASGATQNATNSGFYVNPVRNDTGNTSNVVYYNATTKELTYAPASAGSSITNGTSNVVVAASSNVTIGVAGTAAVATFATTGEYVTGVVSATGNITGGNISATNHTGTNVSVTGTITAASTVGGVITGSSASVSGTVTGASLTGTITTASQTNITSVGTLGALSVTGNVTAGGHVGTIYTNSIINTGANATGNIGSSSLYFNTVFAKATSAQYADLAEMYCADAPYTPGTVVEFNGTAEITITTESHSTRVAGIISTNPSYLMNATLDCENALEVALVGRVPCSVVGTIYKGDRLVASGSYPGVATALDMSQYQPGCIVAKALEDYNSTEPGIIEVAVGRT